MRTLQYRVTYRDGSIETVQIYARTINSGFAKVLKIAKQPLGSTVIREITRLEFWQVVS